MLIALLATVISTADSSFLPGSSSIVNDISRTRLKSPTATSLLRWSTVAVLTTSAVAYLMPLSIPDLIALCSVATPMPVSGLLAPVIVGLFWKGGSRRAGVRAMWSGLVVAVAWQLLGQPWGWHPVFVGLPIAILVLVLGSLILRDPTPLTQSWYRHSRTLDEEVPAEEKIYD